MNTFYYLSSCDTCKRIMKELNLPEEITLVDLKKGVDEATIDGWFAHTQSYEALLNKRAQKLKGIDKNNLKEADIRNLLLTHYTFIKRPILSYQKQLFIGNAKATVAAAIKALHE